MAGEGQSRDNGAHAQNKQEVCHAAARDVAKCHVRMAVNGGNDRDHELGHGGSHGHDREADDAVGQANSRGYLARSVDEQVGTPNKKRKSNNDKDELQEHGVLSDKACSRCRTGNKEGAERVRSVPSSSFI